ncbi:lysostaphin resistance A-like protein [Rubrivirga sp.]|uniref:CPBP family intramembrane glutamic endopeptidase n=1 Tax=Rubrivirga sp. TaxID=1885344 RepID=UPI003C72283C
MDHVLNAGLLALLVSPLVALALATSRSNRWRPALAFLALLALDDLLTVGAFLVPSLGVFGGDWNWEGKVLSVIGSLVIVAMSSLSWREVGATLRQREGSVRPAIIATALFTAFSFGIGLAFDGGPFDLETLAFQLSMPGIAEELAYRGVLFALLVRSFGEDSWWPVAITSVAFSIWHGFGVEDGVASFDWLSASFPFLGGIAYGWLRHKTGSILFPTVAHNLGNTAALVGGAL